MSQELQPGDFLVFQLEAGYGLLRVLAVEEMQGERLWHLRAYSDLFGDVASAETATADLGNLSVALSHAALTNRAFESTQVAKISNAPLLPREMEGFTAWLDSDDQEVSDRSIRLLLGLR